MLLPQSLCVLSEIQTIQSNFGRIQSGAIPSSLGDLTSLTQLMLSSNQLEGIVRKICMRCFSMLSFLIDSTATSIVKFIIHVVSVPPGVSLTSKDSIFKHIRKRLDEPDSSTEVRSVVSVPVGEPKSCAVCLEPPASPEVNAEKRHAR